MRKWLNRRKKWQKIKSFGTWWWFHRWSFDKRTARQGLWVRGVDLKFNEFTEVTADDFVLGDLREQQFVRSIIDQKFDEVYQLAAHGGPIYFYWEDADVMHNSALININALEACHQRNIKNIFILSVCMYPEHNQ